MAWSEKLLQLGLAMRAARQANQEAMTRFLMPIQIELREREKDRQKSLEITKEQQRMSMIAKQYDLLREQMRQEGAMARALAVEQAKINAGAYAKAPKAPPEPNRITASEAIALTKSLADTMGYDEEKTSKTLENWKRFENWLKLPAATKKSYSKDAESTPTYWIPYAQLYKEKKENATPEDYYSVGAPTPEEVSRAIALKQIAPQVKAAVYGTTGMPEAETMPALSKMMLEMPAEIAQYPSELVLQGPPTAEGIYPTVTLSDSLRWAMNKYFPTPELPQEKKKQPPSVTFKLPENEEEAAARYGLPKRGQ